ncbi:uncharacterized protein LOC115676270 isoform X3 [Syzygium oleosum]|uniref:uncharacterized protein LOC115676270 isoform X3 n=1 Tax=Syzygium oleosum TaxID=219896 RepID=UPI0024BA0522|nr:uncharacterized protein LOC115676270 isoform X3 [Syzygium oleosum]
MPGDKTQCRSMKVQGNGGAANALTCLARLGVRARLMSKIADDVPGKCILGELKADGVDTSFLVENTYLHLHTRIPRHGTG